MNHGNQIKIISVFQAKLDDIIKFYHFTCETIK